MAFLRFALLAVIPALAFVLLQAGRRRHRRGFSLPEQLPLPLDLLPLRVDSLLLPATGKTKKKAGTIVPRVATLRLVCSPADLMRFWKAYPSVHCSVKEAPCRTVVKWPRRRRSCMLLSLQDIFSCFDCRNKKSHFGTF